MVGKEKKKGVGDGNAVLNFVISVFLERASKKPAVNTVSKPSNPLVVVWGFLFFFFLILPALQSFKKCEVQSLCEDQELQEPEKRLT